MITCAAALFFALMPLDDYAAADIEAGITAVLSRRHVVHAMMLMMPMLLPIH